MPERPRLESPRPRLESPSSSTCWSFFRRKCVRCPLCVAALFAAVSVIGLCVLPANLNLFSLDKATITFRDVKGTDDHLQESATQLPPCFSSPEATPSEGKWRRSPNGVKDSPAGWDDWGRSLTSLNFYRTCETRWNNPEHPGPALPRPYWTWEPSRCALAAVDEANFCRVMKGRKGLLLVGDSLTRLSTVTLASILHANLQKSEPGTADLEDRWVACGGELNVRFMRNDYLDARTKPPYATQLCEQWPGGPAAANTRCTIFANDHTLRDFDTLVVNSGAHPRTGPQYKRNMTASAEALTKSMNRLHGKDNAILVVRNTVPGHWGCTERMFDAPVNGTIAAKLVAGAPPEYHWNTFHNRNAQLQEAFSPDKGWKLLDAYTPTVLRADSHFGKGDCLHYCLPGPADHWITLLYNILAAAERA